MGTLTYSAMFQLLCFPLFTKKHVFVPDRTAQLRVAHPQVFKNLQPEQQPTTKDHRTTNTTSFQKQNNNYSNHSSTNHNVVSWWRRSLAHPRCVWCSGDCRRGAYVRGRSPGWWLHGETGSAFRVTEVLSSFCTTQVWAKSLHEQSNQVYTWIKNILRGSVSRF